MHRLIYTFGLLLPLLTACGETNTSEVPTPAPGDRDGDGYAIIDGEEGEDCDDSNASINPAATEICDGIDNNCSGVIDDLGDSDGDGFGTCSADELGADCDDSDATIYPGATEVPYDGIDQDCDGRDTLDGDGDGVTATEAGGLDCDDTNPAIGPEATDIPYDGIDQDCSGSDLTDADGDGFDATVALGTDCDDTSADIHPEAEERLDGIDNNCDGILDEALIAEAPALWMGEYAQDAAGSSVASAGDVDGDGLEDFIIGAPDADGSGVDSGKAYLLLGVDGATERHDELAYASVTFVGTRALDRAGYSVAGVGDINGDGLGDLAITAPGDPEVLLGEVYILLGREDGWPSRVSLSEADGVLTGSAPGQGDGLNVAYVGDVNGDEIDDLAVGLPLLNSGALDFSSTAEDIGAVAIFWGGEDRIWDGTLTGANQLWLGESAGALAGTRLGSVGDWTGDGRVEVIIGAPGEGGGAGRGYLLFGHDVPGAHYLADADVQILGDASGDALGQSLSGAGDLNGDGYRDLAIGAPGAEEQAGEVYVFLGKPSGLANQVSVGRADGELTGLAAGEAFGTGVAIVDGPVGGDLWVSSPGEARLSLFSGTSALEGESREDADASLIGDEGSGLGRQVGATALVGPSGRGVIIAGAPSQLVGEDEESGQDGAGAVVLIGGP